MIEEYLRLPGDRKRELLNQTAALMGVAPVIVEKDFWVTALLGLLFSHPETRDRFVFKGGTSLSKVYGVIERFSEDVDLAMDWRLIGLGEFENDPWDPDRSRTKQDLFNKSLREKTRQYLRDSFVPLLHAALPGDVRVTLSESVEQGVEVRYPRRYIQEGMSKTACC